VESVITKKTKAVVAVDYAGHPADMDELRTITNKHGIYLIEDAAHSVGSLYKDRPIGSIADITTFSFFPTKNLTTGEGGALSSNNKELLDRARRFSRQGIVREPAQFQLKNEGPWHQEVQEFGLNYRLPDVLCALGSSQLQRLDDFKSHRRELFAKYKDYLGDIETVRLPVEREFVSTNWHLYPIRVPSDKRLGVFNELRNNGIGVQVNYLPAHLHPVFASVGKAKSNLPNSETFYNEAISLPMWPGILDLPKSYFELVAQILKEGC
jgi:dTDP-4-amino-4,6-dideoxygalactose transaminase